LASFAAVSCGRGVAADGSPDGEAPVRAGLDGGQAQERDPSAESLWARAADGDAEDLARLYDREGETGLEERGALPVYRLTALRALGFGHDFLALPWLAEIAGSGTDEEAKAALESARSVAGWPRPARDPEDALELREGCDRLITLVMTKDKPRDRRAHAASILRMLTPFGCARADAIPADLDAK
jgi:hypothetical protein